ncbi:MAG: nitroreductase family protein [Dehalococcoidia bacterium]|nr:MAG: nitroreductase family protein [Dehalococcoidia bacterium]
MSLFKVDKAKCNYCRMCALECPAGVIAMASPKTIPSLAGGGEERCILCGHCVAVCAPGAFSHREIKPEGLERMSKRLLPSPAQAERFLKSRRSIRAYKKKPVLRELLAKVIDIARYAPSGRNSQPVQWLVIEDRQEVKRLAGMVIDWMRMAIQTVPDIASQLHFDLMAGAWDLGADYIMHGAPHAIIAHAPKDLPLAEGSCYIALTYLELAAYSQGLGACWAGWFQIAATSHPPITEALQLPEGHKCYGAMMIGYPRHRFTRIPIRNEPAITWR